MTESPQAYDRSLLRRARGPLLAYATLLVGSSVGRVVSFATSVLLARHLSQAAFGEFSIFFGVVLVVAEATNFVDFTYVRFANTDPADRKAHLRAALSWKNSALVALALLAVPLGALLSSVFKVHGLTWMLALAVVTGALLNVLSLQFATYLADEKFLRLTIFNTVYALLVLAVLSAFVLESVRLSRLTIGFTFACSAAAVAVVCYARLWRVSGGGPVDRKLLRRSLAFGKWLAAGNIAYLIGQRIDLFVVSAFASLRDVGNYGAALRLAVVASIMTAALPALLLPRASRTVGSTAAVASFLRHAVAISCLICMLTALLWLVTPVVVDTLLGTRYHAAVQLARVMLIGTALAGFSTSLSQLFLADERPRRAFYVRLVKAVAVLALAIPLASAFGGTGVAWAVTISELVVLVYVLLEIKPFRVATIR